MKQGLVLVAWLDFLLFYIQHDMSEMGLRAGCLYVHTLGGFDLMGHVDIINPSADISGDVPECIKQGPPSQQAPPASCEGQLCKDPTGLAPPCGRLKREGRMLKVTGRLSPLVVQVKRMTTSE